MKRIRASLSYSNVVATLALFLALTGGAVWAADKITSKQIGKGAVKTKNLAKNAVKKKNLAKNAVTTNKLAKGAVKSAKLGDGAVNFAKIAAGTNVIASITGGPASVNQELVDIPQSAPLSVTPVAGQPLSVNVEVRGKLTATGGESCFALVLPSINGSPSLAGEPLVLVSPPTPPEPPFPNGISRASLSFPLGLTEPGVPQNITLQALGSPGKCTADSRIDQVAVVVTQTK